MIPDIEVEAQYSELSTLVFLACTLVSSMTGQQIGSAGITDALTQVRAHDVPDKIGTIHLLS